MTQFLMGEGRVGVIYGIISRLQGGVERRLLRLQGGAEFAGIGTVVKNKLNGWLSRKVYPNEEEN
jgi:hypothetical protein